MKQIAIILSAVLIAGCSSFKEIKSVKTTQVKQEIKQTALSEVKNLKCEERKSEVVLTWDLPNENEIDKIIVAKKGADNRLKRIPLKPDARSYTINLPPLEKTVFYIKLQYKTGEVTPGEKITATAKLGTAIFKESEFIDTASDTVKLLFKTNPRANVEVYFGESSEKLTLSKKEENYDFKRGIKIGGLVPGKKYYYKIISELNGEKTESAIVGFEKKANETVVRKAEWAREAVFYEVFVRSFYDSNKDGIGDFRGLGDKMGYFKELGIDGLWLMPSFKSDTYHGYDIVDYFDVEEDYGSIADFEYMMTKAKENGVKIILDFVINHTSSNNKWFEAATSDKQTQYRDYYVWADPFDDKEAPGPWGQNVWYDDGDKYYYAVFTSGMPDLNFRNPLVRDEVKKAAKFWLDKGVDGFRLDASRHIDDLDVEVTLSWWNEFNMYVKSINKDAFLVGEAWDSNPAVVALYMKALDSSFNFGFSEFMTEQVRKGTPDTVDMLKATREAYSKEAADFIDCTFVRNHDMPRTASEFRDVERQKSAFTMLLTLPGTPFLYYGEELGQKGMKPDEQIREPMDWYKSMSGEGMTAWNRPNYNKADDGISLEEQIGNPESLYNYIKKLIQIRKEYKLMFSTMPEKIEAGTMYGYRHKLEKGNIDIIYNFSKETKEYKRNPEQKGINLINNKEIGDGFQLKPGEVLIVKYE